MFFYDTLVVLIVLQMLSRASLLYKQNLFTKFIANHILILESSTIREILIKKETFGLCAPTLSIFKYSSHSFWQCCARFGDRLSTTVMFWENLLLFYDTILTKFLVTPVIFSVSFLSILLNSTIWTPYITADKKYYFVKQVHLPLD